MTSSARLTKDRKRHDPASLREFGAGPIEIRTLGGVRIRQGTTDITHKVGKRHLAVLIYVLHERRPVRRRDLLSLLGRGGADHVEDEAVSRTVVWLDHNLHGIDVELTPESVAIGGNISMDSVELLEAFERGDAEKARQLYLGRFLEGFKGPGQRFDDWAEGERLRLHEAWLETMRSAAAAAETAGIWTIAAEWWRAIVERDPLKDDAVARLLLTLGLAKDSKGAALAYSGYRARLREHGVAEPPDVVKRVASKLELPEPVATRRPNFGSASSSLSGPGAYVDSDEAYIDPDDDPNTSDKVVVLRPDSISVGDKLGENEEEGRFFTDSFIVYAVKTGWARLTSPRELERARDQLKSYGALLAELFEAIRTILAALTRPIWNLARSAYSTVSQWFQQKRRRAARRTPPSARPGSQASAKSTPQARPARSARRRSQPGTSAGASYEQAAPAAVSPPRPDSTPRTKLEAKRALSTRRSRKRRGGVPLFARMSRNIAWRASLRSAWRGLVSLPRKALEYPVATLVLFIAIGVLLAPASAWEWGARQYIGAETRVSNFSLPTVPKIRVSLPDLRPPGFSGGLPDFIQRPLWTASDFFTGSLLESGDRVVVADVETRLDEAGPPQQLIGLALESQLAQSKYFATVPRERVLMAAGSAPDRSLSLPSDRALDLASGAAARAIVSGAVSRDEEGYKVRLVVLDPSGIEMASVEGEKANLLGALDEAARDIRHKLGEPAAEIDNSEPTAKILTNSFEALAHYAEARALLESGAYGRAIRAASAALDIDPNFAAVHRLQGDALALSGDHRSARVALERAWKSRIRLSERERLRLQADRLALRGDGPDAILAYDELFTSYRHDVAALKSQAILQEAIGVRGGGSGNLRVAYSIDRQDWPPLSRIARFLDYRGPIPEITPYINLASEPGDSID